MGYSCDHAIVNTGVLELVRATHPTDGLNQPLHMLAGYWDESGHADDPQCHHLGIGGLIAPASRWARFEIMWRATLNAFDLSYFHTVDFVNYTGAFSDRDAWPETRRRALMARLLDAIAEARPSVHAALSSLTAWRGLAPKEQGLFQDPWFCCLQECVRLASAHCVVDRERIDMVFSQQTEFVGKAAQLWGLMKQSSWPGFGSIGAFAMDDMRRVLPLQAADLVAYEAVKSIGDASGTVRHPARYPFRALVGIDPNAFIVYIDASYLAWQVEGAKYMPELFSLGGDLS